jgi:hypothetical protein
MHDTDAERVVPSAERKEVTTRSVPAFISTQRLTVE